MATPEELFDLAELCRRCGVSERTVRYYIQRGLLPRPGAGRGPKYDQGYLNRLRLIRQLQSRHLPLEEIKAQLQGMDDSAVALALHSTGKTVRSSAADYIDAVLRGSTPEQGDAGDLPPAASGEQREAWLQPGATPTGPERVAEAATGLTGTSPRPAGESWDRYELGDGLELHVRRPGSRERNRRIERIIAAAERILKE